MPKPQKANHAIWLVVSFLLLVATSTGVLAKRKDRNEQNKQDAIAWCKNFSKKESIKCAVGKCPCGVGKRKIKSFDRKRSRAYCVCISKAAKKDINKQRAMAACKDYTKKYGRKCVVYKGNCPVKLMPVAKFKGGALIKYSACRPKDGAERLKKAANIATMARPSSQLLVSAYASMFARIKAKAGTATVLPRATRLALQKHFPSVNLDKVTIAHSSSKFVMGCITDCKRIYCKRKTTVDGMKAGTITQLLVHETAHTEQCSKWGGRNNYALKWFRHLPVGVVKGIKKGEEKYMMRLHDKMPMEAGAEKKAIRVCKLVEGCILDAK